jgi:hypothetical protein
MRARRGRPTCGSRKLDPTLRVSSVLLRLSRRDPFPESQAPHSQLAQTDEGMRGRNGIPISVRITSGSPDSLEGAPEDREGELLLGGQRRLACQQVATGVVRDRQGVAVPAIAEEKFPFVVGTPQRHSARWGVRAGSRSRVPRRPRRWRTIKHGVDRADGAGARPVNCCRSFSRILGAPSPDTPASSARSSAQGAPAVDSPAGRLGGSDR